MTLFERTKEAAKKRGMSLQDAAKAAGIGINSIYQWKTQTPSAERIKLVADVLGVSVDYLLGNSGEIYTNKNTDNTIDLDKALSDKGVVMKFQGRELSDKAKRGLLDILNLIDGDKE